MNLHLKPRPAITAISLGLLLGFSAPVRAYSPKPDLTAAGVIATLKTDANSSPVYGETYNLGPTGLRGWIYRDPNNMGQEGLITAQDRQILVTVVGAGTPAAGVLAVDDVILGVRGGSGPVSAFTSDCRKAFGVAIGAAETVANAGVLGLLRWRAGTTTEVSITLPANVRESYTDTAPYNCPKSSQILANAIAKLSQESLSGGWTGAAKGLALLAAVKPGDANYAAVQTKLQTYARSVAPANLHLTGCDTWNWGYLGTFLGEYYLRTVEDGNPDASVLHGISEYTVALAKGQSKYGTFGHGGAERHADGSLHGSISWYGPVNAAGLAANLAIIMGRKAILASGGALDLEIEPAIERASKFFGYFVNKGGIPYGEHEPWSGGHASNGKDAMAAVLFGLQDNRPVETEYFTRMSAAGFVGREYGHTGQGFSYLWAALGAAMGGDAAAAAHLKQVRWHLDLERRTDGTFVYDGGEQYGGGKTDDGTYLGASGYYGLSPTACYVLTYALPLKRLLITGRNANPANTLDATKVANAIAAATYERDCPAYSVATLIAALGEYDPVVRHDAAAELAKRTLTTGEVNSLIALITNGTMSPDANVRQGACETLGLRKTTGALTALSQRLSDADHWVRGKASNALKNFGSAASGQLTPMLTAFTANATDPEVIVWDDPIQIANGYLADSLFKTLASSTIAASKSLLYPAVRAGLKQPDGMARMYLGDFIKNRLTLADVQAVAPSLVAAAAERSPADRMFSDVIRYAALNTLAKYKIEEGIPLCLMVKEQTWHGDDWDPFTLLQNTYRGAAKDALPTLYKWQAHLPLFAADSSTNTGDRLANITTRIASTIAAIESDAAPPTLAYFKTLTATANPAAVTLPTTSTVLTPVLADLDAGTPNFLWSKVSGAGAVTFDPPGMTGNATCTATFETPGTYVLRVTAVDRSILDYNQWITYSLGYYDFETYNEILGAVTKNVTVTVSPDPNRAPVPQNQSLITPTNTDATITLAATDPNGDPMTYAVVTQPPHGTLTGTAPNLVYTPTTGYTGSDSFTFKANDGKVDSAAATITIEVGVVGNRRPVAVNQWATTAEDTAKSVILSGSDPDSDSLIYEIVTGPAHGTLTGTAPNLNYQPAANYPAGNAPGADSFTFTVRDAALTSAVATVSLTVTPVNDAPQAVAQSRSVSANSVNPITLTGSDPEGHALSYAVAGNPSHGTLTGTAPNLTYRPTPNYRGPDSFTFRVTDSEGVVSPAATLSITIINDPPVANPRFVELQPNTGTAVTLTGSDSANDPLTFTVLTQPAHGVLTGTAPTLTYTPATDFTGADSFTFKANDGVNDSTAAAVTLNVVAWQTWTNLAAGTWSTGTNWTGGVAPTAGGSSTGLLVFNASTYSGTSSNDLAGAFQLNRLNLGSALPALTVSGNALSFAMNSATLPQVNLNSANAVTFSNNIVLAANTTLGGTGAGALTFSGIISGTGSLTKTISGNLTLSGTNTYSGGTTVSGGIFTLGNKNGCGTGSVTLAAGTTFQQVNFEGNSSSGALPNALILSGSGNVIINIPFGGGKDIWLSQTLSGTGGMTVQGGTRSLTLTASNSFSGGIILRNYDNRVQIAHASALGTGTFRSERITANSGQLVPTANLSAGIGVSNAFEIAAGAYLNVNANGTSHLLLSGPITNPAGTGNLYKAGTASLTLTGANTYTGKTTVGAGTLTCTSAASLGGGALDLTTGATLQLNYTGTRRVAALTFNAGAAQPDGTYGSSTSGATYQSSYFSGPGTVTVGPAFEPTTTTLVLASGSTPTGVGTSLTFAATVTGSTPTGTVTFYSGPTLLGTGTLNGSFQASFTTTSLALGSYAITARYAGNSTNDPSVSAVLPIQIIAPPAPPTNLVAAPGNNTVGMTWNAATGATGYNVKRAGVSGGPYAPLGTTNGTGYADGTASNGTTYYYVVSATNGAGESANSGQVSATPMPPTPLPTTLASSLGASGSYGTAVTFTASVTAAATGMVTFKNGTTVLGTGTVNAGQATYATSTLAAGGHSLTAIYEGDATYAPSTSAAFSYTVSAKTVTITGVTAGDKVYDGNPTAVLTGGAVAGVINGDTVTVVAGTGTFASANVGTWAVTATGYALGGTHAGNYELSPQPAVANATITARPLQLAGTRVYDGTTTVAAASLVIGNKVGADDITLTGNTDLPGKDVGPQAITTRYATPVRVRSAAGYSAASTSTSFTVTMGATPAAGNTLIAVISSRGAAANQISGLSSTGASWARAAQSTNTSGSTLEIWSAPVGSGAGAVVTIATTTGRCAGVVIEYSGLLTTASPVDQWAISNNIGTAAVTGTTAATSQANEVWIGGIGYRSSTPTLGSILNSFTSVASAKTTSTTPANNVMAYALEAIVSATGTAGSGGTLTASATWSGAIATFKAAATSTLALTGPAAGNYTLAGATGEVATTAKPLTVTAVTASKTYDGTTTAAGTPILAPPLAAGDTATFLAQSFADANAGAGNKVIIPSITINDGNGGANYAVTLENHTTGTISPAPASITLGNLTATYTGTPKAVSATTDPTGLKVNLTYNEAPTAPTQPGTYAVVAVINDINYTGNAVGTLVIAAESIAAWRERHFTTAEIADGLAADGTDPEGDGFTNLAEYTLGTDPRAFSPQPLTIAPAAGNNFTLTFLARAASGAGYAGRMRKYDVECSSDLADSSSWQGVSGYANIVGGDHTVVATLPMDATKKFYRLNVRLE
jgi:autotransporter-associated beta strand protein